MPPGEGGPLAVALLATFVAGLFAVWFLVNYLKRRSLQPFVIYRIVLSAVLFAMLLRGLGPSWGRLAQRRLWHGFGRGAGS